MIELLRKDFIKWDSKNGIKQAFGKLDNIFQDEFNRILSQQSIKIRFFLSHNWIQRVKLKIRFQNLLILPFRPAMFWNYDVGIHKYSALTYDIINSYLTHVWDKKMAILHWKEGLLCDKLVYQTFKWNNTIPHFDTLKIHSCGNHFDTLRIHSCGNHFEALKIHSCGNHFDALMIHSFGKHFDALMIHSCGKYCEKRRNCLWEAISPFLTVFSSLYATYFSFECTLKCRLQFVSIWTSVKLCRLVMG